MQLNEYKQGRNIREFLFPYILNRTNFLIRVIIIGLCVGLPFHIVKKQSISKLNYVRQQLVIDKEVLRHKLHRLNELKSGDKASYQKELGLFDMLASKVRGDIQEARTTSGILIINMAFLITFYVMSFWMLFIPRLRSMRRPLKLVWIMAIPLVNIVFFFFLTLSPPKL
jgi:hypothetical protein